MSKLLDRLRKNTVVKPELLRNSKYFASGEICSTRVPLLNLALTGSLKDGGLPTGITMIAAPPKHFKTNFMIELLKAFEDKNEGKDYIIVLYDSEKGYTKDYFIKAGLNLDKIDHRFVTSVEELRSDIANLVHDIEEGDNVLIAIDSIGMLPSSKEVADALSESDKADMTRAKALKSMFRIITPHISLKNVPVVVINHSYQDMGLFPKEVAGGGRGAQYAGHTLWFITKAQEKDGDELEGFRFTIKSGLSRYVKENSTFPVIAKFGEGIEKYSGMFDFAAELGYFKSLKKGWWIINDDESKSYRRADLEVDETIMESLLNDPEFCEKVEAQFRL